MSRPVAILTSAVVAISLLVAAGPTLVGLAEALPAVILAVGLVVALLRSVWFVRRRR